MDSCRFLCARWAYTGVLPSERQGDIRKRGLHNRCACVADDVGDRRRSVRFERRDTLLRRCFFRNGQRIYHNGLINIAQCGRDEPRAAFLAQFHALDRRHGRACAYRCDTSVLVFFAFHSYSARGNARSHHGQTCAENEKHGKDTLHNLHLHDRGRNNTVALRRNAAF